MVKNSSFYDFVSRTRSQKEVSLIIAQNDKELDNFKSALQEQGFRRVIGVYQLLTNITFPSKVFIVINKELSKEVYDFIIQYPTGQIEIFDKDRMSGKVTKPSYEDVSLVFIITKENLSKIQKKVALLENVGVTYQV